MNKKKILSLIMGVSIMAGVAGNAIAMDKVNVDTPKYSNNIIEKDSITPTTCIDLRGYYNEVDFKVVDEKEIENNKDLMTFVEQNRGKEKNGTYVYKEDKDANYIMVSYGAANGGGHELNVNRVTLEGDYLAVAYEHYQSESGKLMRNISFPYVLIKVDKSVEFKAVKSYEDKVITIDGDFFNELTGEYHIVGMIASVDEKKDYKIVEVERIGASMKVKINKDVIEKDQYENIKKGCKVDIRGKESKDIKGDTVIEASEIKTWDVKEFEKIQYRSLMKYQIEDENLLKFIEENERKKGVSLYRGDKSNYIVVSGGEVPTGGYKLNIDGVYQVGDKVKVNYSIENPPKGNMVIQVISYPVLILEISKDIEINDVIQNKSNDKITLFESEKTNLEDMTLTEIKEKMQRAEIKEKLAMTSKLIEWFNEVLNK